MRKTEGLHFTRKSKYDKEYFLLFIHSPVGITTVGYSDMDPDNTKISST